MLTTPSAGAAGNHEEQLSAPDTSSSGVAWPAILGGAFAAIALAVLLFTLGAGLGLASTSPWPNAGASVTTFTATAAIWLIVTHWLASGLGGYLTGRLRTKWAPLHTHEVFFRDTANGFLMWAVATVIGAVVVTSVASFVVSGSAAIVAKAASGAPPLAAQADNAMPGPSAYLIDSLFRTDRPNPGGSATDIKAESSQILISGLRAGDVPAPDKTYLAQLVSARTGLSQEDAAKRVDAVIADAKTAQAKAGQAADIARKVGATISIYTALAMLIGAFIACSAAALGGQQRDEY
jgi:hypothetical protein